MTAPVEVASNRATAAQIEEHLARCNADFPPPGRPDVPAYARELVRAALRFEAWSDGVLVGLVAAYVNDAPARVAFVTNVSVLRERTREGIATRLLALCLDHARAAGMRELRLDAARANAPALRLYEKLGFVAGAERDAVLTLHRDLRLPPPGLL
jgi:ribosomal protein S18 acetylase RimI-like enzyme